MSRRLEAQQRFAQQAAMLVRAAYTRGIDLTYGDAARDRRIYKIIKWAFAHGYEDGLPQPKCHPESLHFSRLAIDLNAFRGGVYLQGAEADAAHRELHDLWLTLGGAPMIEGDANHYSFAFDGMR